MRLRSKLEKKLYIRKTSLVLINVNDVHEKEIIYDLQK